MLAEIAVHSPSIDCSHNVQATNFGPKILINWILISPGTNAESFVLNPFNQC